MELLRQFLEIIIQGLRLIKKRGDFRLWLILFLALLVGYFSGPFLYIHLARQYIALHYGASWMTHPVSWLLPLLIQLLCLGAALYFYATRKKPQKISRALFLPQRAEVESCSGKKNDMHHALLNYIQEGTMIFDRHHFLLFANKAFSADFSSKKRHLLDIASAFSFGESMISLMDDAVFSNKIFFHAHAAGLQVIKYPDFSGNEEFGILIDPLVILKEGQK